MLCSIKNDMILKQVDLTAIETLRIAYLKSLPEFQELYMEMLVAESVCYRIEEPGNVIGYVAVTSEKILVEYYLNEEFIGKNNSIFNFILKELAIAEVYCKSFDAVLLDSCLLSFKNFEIIGTLFRNYTSTPNFYLKDMVVKTAEEADIPFLLEQKDGLYETPQELETFVNRRCVLMFFKNNNLIGCGYLIKIHLQWNYYDIGMWVNPDYRKQGSAVQIISYLKHFCIHNNWKPICGCAFDNIASQKTLEKNGFYSKFKLLEFR